IAQRRDPQHIRRGVEGDQFLARERIVEVDDRLPFERSEATVDPSDRLLGLAAHLLELLHPRPGRYGDLDEGNRTVPIGVPLEETLEALEPLDRALHV